FGRVLVSLSENEELRMSRGSSRRVSKEEYWRDHLERQSAAGCSIRSYCHRHDLSEASFHYWRRRKIAGGDAEPMGCPVPTTQD
ncbi:IS66 family insertion sequence element accessory protein TnpA, partial [Schlesneria sp.]|uniref:IS66 family insertion sequence element accessory protein TnpA n=1 Tax=Schlesneria sp. TaxID=2762018 RepID=UPI003F81206E